MSWLDSIVSFGVVIRIPPDKASQREHNKYEQSDEQRIKSPTSSAEPPHCTGENGAGCKAFEVVESKVRVFLAPAGNNLSAFGVPFSPRELRMNSVNARGFSEIKHQGSLACSILKETYSGSSSSRSYPFVKFI